MGFVEWYESTFGEKWRLDFHDDVVKVMELAFDYEFYCMKRSIIPVWDG